MWSLYVMRNGRIGSPPLPNPLSELPNDLHPHTLSGGNGLPLRPHDLEPTAAFSKRWGHILSDHTAALLSSLTEWQPRVKVQVLYGILCFLIDTWNSAAGSSQ